MLDRLMKDPHKFEKKKTKETNRQHADTAQRRLGGKPEPWPRRHLVYRWLQNK